MGNMPFTIDHFEKNIRCAHRKTDKIYEIPLHLHNHLEMNLFLGGDILFFINDRSLKPVRGNLSIINNTQIHGPKILSENVVYERAHINFLPKAINTIYQHEIDLLQCFQLSTDLQPKFLSLSEKEINQFVFLVDQIYSIQNNSTTYFGDEIIVHTCLLQLLVLVNRNYLSGGIERNNTENHYPLIIHSLIDFIQSNLANDLSLEIIENKFSMNRHYLNRIFKKELNITIYKFIILNKIALAKKLLSDGLTPIEVASQLSFKDYSTFFRSFKSITSYSPSNYIKSIL